MYKYRTKKAVRITNARQRTEQRQKPHICTIKQLAEETGVSEYTIRRWVKQGSFKVMRSGKKYLINYDIFMKFVNGEDKEAGLELPKIKGIRKVEL